MLEDLMKNPVVKDIRQSIDAKHDIKIEITTTNACNCRCKYCFENIQSYEDVDEIEQQHQIDLLVDLCKNFDPLKFNKMHVVFWGGEPMCNFNFVKQIVDATLQYDFIDYFMYTNGTLYEKFNEFANLFHKNRKRFTIQFSYDGEPHHSLMRGNTSGQMLDSARMMHKNGFKIGFKATVSFDALDVFPQCWKSYEKLYDEFGDCIAYSPTLDTIKKDITNEMYDVWKKSVVEVFKYEYDFILKHKRPLLSWLSTLDTNYENKASCNLNYHATICTNGDIHVCHGCQYSSHKDDFIIGRTKDITSLNQVIGCKFTTESFKLPDECIKCGASFCNICHVAQVNSNSYVDDWASCRTNNELRCKFFKFFGKATNALHLAMMKR